jgi:hypothetical protein
MGPWQALLATGPGCMEPAGTRRELINLQAGIGQLTPPRLRNRAGFAVERDSLKSRTTTVL